MTFPSLEPRLAAVEDLGQVILVIVFLVVAFIQWVIRLVKEKSDAAERARQAPTQEEEEARRRAWEEQTRPVTPAPQQTPPSGGGTLSDLFGEIRRAYEQATNPAPPPPLPPLPQPDAQRTRQQFREKRSATPEAPPLLEPLPLSPAPEKDESTSVVHLTAHQPIRRRESHPLARLLRTEHGYRQAFVLREMIGPPRALQEYRGPED